MIEIKETLTAGKDIEAVWNFFNDIHAVASCVPTVIKYEVEDDDTVFCDLRLKLGLIPLDSKAKVRITARETNRHLEVKGETQPGETLKKFGKLTANTVTMLHITLDFEEISPFKTRIRFLLRADAVGQMKRVYDSIIKSQQAKLERQFIANVEQGLGTRVVVEQLDAAPSGFSAISGSL